jgi:hypothetical protein
MRQKSYKVLLFFLLLLSSAIAYFIYFYLFLKVELGEYVVEDSLIVNGQGIYENKEILLEHIDEENLRLDFENQSKERFSPMLVNQQVNHIETVQENKNASEYFKRKQHLFSELSKKVFMTLEERQQFFVEIGVEYLNEIIFDYLPALKINSHMSERYLLDKKTNDDLTKLYGADIATQKLINLSIRWLGEEIGHGVFAEQDLAPGDFIGIYAGVVQEKLLVRDRDYAWSYPGQTLDGGRITLDAAKKGNELRLINDGRDPNCIVKYIIGMDNLWHVCYIAAKNIKKGDQLLISYGDSYWNTRKYKYQELVER